MNRRDDNLLGLLGELKFRHVPKIVWFWGLRLRLPWWWPTPISNWKVRRACRQKQAAEDYANQFRGGKRDRFYDR